jgi:hypothetical protein
VGRGARESAQFPSVSPATVLVAVATVLAGPASVEWEGAIHPGAPPKRPAGRRRAPDSAEGWFLPSGPALVDKTSLRFSLPWRLALVIHNRATVATWPRPHQLTQRERRRLLAVTATR